MLAHAQLLRTQRMAFGPESFASETNPTGDTLAHHRAGLHLLQSGDSHMLHPEVRFIHQQLFADASRFFMTFTTQRGSLAHNAAHCRHGFASFPGKQNALCVLCSRQRPLTHMLRLKTCCTRAVLQLHWLLMTC